MKKMKKFLAILLALTMVLSLAACGGSTTEEKTEAPAAEASEGAIRLINGKIEVAHS